MNVRIERAFSVVSSTRYLCEYYDYPSGQGKETKLITAKPACGYVWFIFRSDPETVYCERFFVLRELGL